MDYIVLFDVASKPHLYFNVPWLLVLVILMAFLIASEFKRDADAENFLTRNWTRIMVALVLIPMAWHVWQYESDRRRWTRQLARGHVSVVEGAISNVTKKHIGSKSPGTEVCFTVEDERFCYRTNESTPAMTSCPRIVPDLRVRMSYNSDKKPILRLEARRDSLEGINSCFE
jgi:hypothetical protein